MDFLLSYAPFVVFLVLGYTVGSWRERSHFQSLDAREGDFKDLGIVSLKSVQSPETVRDASLVLGQAVIATDYFKGVASRLRGVVGGEIRSYSSLMERARREATLRLLEEARARGASEIWNVRYETSNVLSSSRRNPAVSVEVFAYGTAVSRSA